MPTLAVSEDIHAERYRAVGETYRDYANRVADALKDSTAHFYDLREILMEPRFLPAGRIQSAVGSTRQITPFNCFVSGSIPDSMDGIMTAATKAAQTLRMGGGIGYDFSSLRPRGDLIASLQSTASGPVSFMSIFDAVCGTVCAAGHRRGAQMGILRVDHPDIVEFVKVKQNNERLTNFNISVAVTDEFMEAIEAGASFDLRFGGRKYASVDASVLWADIMRSTWDWAEPGVVFIDTVNRLNNLHYCETIAATNPCGEQPLPPHGACLLGSFVLTSYLYRSNGAWCFDEAQFRRDIPVVVRAIDNVIDKAIYPLPEQECEAKNKRRMGLGITGTANALEALGLRYGSPEYLARQTEILTILRDKAYWTSAELADEKEPFPLMQPEYLEGAFIATLPGDLRECIGCVGIRNSHLLSIAPTGTISITADNISSGIEPPFALEYDRKVHGPNGDAVFRMQDYGHARFGVAGKTALECTVDEHVDVLCAAQRCVDSAVSKTCNVGPDVTWEQFSEIYFRAWRGGAKGCTTHRAEGLRAGILTTVDEEKEKTKGAACRIKPDGTRSCDD